MILVRVLVLLLLRELNHFVTRSISNNHLRIHFLVDVEIYSCLRMTVLHLEG
jgi:hypothetical protein